MKLEFEAKVNRDKDKDKEGDGTPNIGTQNNILFSGSRDEVLKMIKENNIEKQILEIDN
jgi:hypothetical protein